MRAEHDTISGVSSLRHPASEVTRDVHPAAAPEVGPISYLELTGNFNPGPISDLIRSQSFDVAVTYNPKREYRGVEQLSPTFRKAIQSSYTPFCVYGGYMFHLPKGQADPGSLRERLLRTGCTPVSDLQRDLLFGW